MDRRASFETRTVDGLGERVPFRDWSPELKAQWEEFSSARINRELRFMHWLGLASCIACLFFDAQAGVLGAGLVLRLGLVVPAYLVGIALLRRAEGPRRALATVGPIVMFVGVTSYFGTSAPGVFADRYLMASAMLLAFSIVLLPLRTGTLAISTFGMIPSALHTNIYTTATDWRSKSAVSHRLSGQKCHDFAPALRGLQGRRAARLRLRDGVPAHRRHERAPGLGL